MSSFHLSLVDYIHPGPCGVTAVESVEGKLQKNTLKKSVGLI